MQKLPGTTAHFYDLQIFYGLQNVTTPRGSAERVKRHGGRGACFQLYCALIKPIKPARLFASFCDFFFQKEKVFVFV
jgi:hypothetical protein